MTVYQYCTRRPLLCICSLALLCLGFLGAWLTIHFAAEQQDAAATRYGQALADRASSQAVEPSIAQDMISLQVILQSLVRQPGVSSATVHDVENNLLVQAGAAQAPADMDSASFAAPITLDTHIAGHLTVNLSLPPVQRAYTSYFWLWALAVLACIAGLWGADYYRERPRKPAKARRPKPRAAPEESTHEEVFAADGDDALPDGADDEANDEPDTSAEVSVELRFLNLRALEQQLSKGEYELRLNRFKQQLQGILALYTGHQQSFDEQSLRLSATADTRSNAIFYAVCISELAVSLCQSGESPRLKVAACIDTHDGDAAPELATYAIWLTPELQDSALSGYINLSDDNLVEEIKPPYKALLERQQTQLLALPVTRRS